MRRGVLLTEEPPHHLMTNQNCSNLEDAFLQLSRRQQEVLDTEKLKGVIKKNINIIIQLIRYTLITNCSTFLILLFR